MPASRLRGHHPPDRAGRTLDVLLSRLSALVPRPRRSALGTLQSATVCSERTVVSVLHSSLVGGGTTLSGSRVGGSGSRCTSLVWSQPPRTLVSTNRGDAEARSQKINNSASPRFVDETSPHRRQCTMRMPVRPLVLACALMWVSLVQAQEPARTWRLDFYQTGGPGIEAYSFDRVVIEPLAWPDNPTANVDSRLTGNYRFEVVDASGRTIFARGYDPAFAEWVTTAESKKIRRTFHDSLRFPALAGSAEIVLRKRDGDGDYDEVWRHAIDPADPFIDRSTPIRQQVIAIERHGEPQAKVDVLLLGDGYTAADCKRTFGAEARRLADALFALEPFKSRRTDFNVWGICPPSAQSGIASPSRGLYQRTPVGAAYDAF